MLGSFVDILDGKIGSALSSLSGYRNRYSTSLFSPETLSELVAWYDIKDADTLTLGGGGTTVTAVTDKSDNAKNLSVPFTAPTYTASNALLGNVATCGSTDERFRIGLVSPSMTAKRVYIVFYYKTGVETTFSNFHTFMSGPPNGGLYNLMGQSGTDDFIFNSTFATNCFKNGSTTNTRLNVLPMAASVLMIESGAARTQTYGFGFQQYADGNRGWIGSWSEIILTTGAESNTVRDKIVGYLAHKSNIQSALVSDHPWKDDFPTA